jgi:hypothetical protein
VSGYIQDEIQFSVPPLTHLGQQDSCPAGEVLTGGGVTLLSPFSASTGQLAPQILSDGPVSSVTWNAQVYNLDPAATYAYGLWIICATANS